MLWTFDAITSWRLFLTRSTPPWLVVGLLEAPRHVVSHPLESKGAHKELHL
jgi:hypothetical protein